MYVKHKNKLYFRANEKQLWIS